LGDESARLLLQVVALHQPDDRQHQQEDDNRAAPSEAGAEGVQDRLRRHAAEQTRDEPRDCDDEHRVESEGEAHDHDDDSEQDEHDCAFRQVPASCLAAPYDLFNNPTRV